MITPPVGMRSKWRHSQRMMRRKAKRAKKPATMNQAREALGMPGNPTWRSASDSPKIARVSWRVTQR